MEELKACPFCGGKAYLRTVMNKNFAECETCYADGPQEASREKAANSWNHRAAPENKPLTCDGCEAEGALQGIRCATCLRLKSEYRNDNYSTEPAP